MSYQVGDNDDGHVMSQYRFSKCDEYGDNDDATIKKTKINCYCQIRLFMSATG